MATLTTTAAKIDKLASELSGAAGQKRLERVARKSLPDVEAAVRADIGDTSMSGWKRTKPIQIRGKVVTTGQQVTIQPTAPGPTRVLEQGRNRGNAAGFQGPGVNRSTGATRRTKSGRIAKVRAFKAKRWNGYTQGKGTWSDAAERVARHYPERMRDEVDDAMAKFFVRG